MSRRSARGHRSTEQVAAFDALYEAHYSRLVVALRMAGSDAGDAEDLAQEAFVRVLVRWRSIADPAAYLFRTAFRLQGRLRSRAARARRTTEASLPAQAASTEEVVLRRRAVADALAHLTLRQRQCAVLALFLGYPTDDVADLLRIRPATVRVHLHAARAALLSSGMSDLGRQMSRMSHSTSGGRRR